MYEMREQPKLALPSYRRVLEQDPDHDEARLRLTGCLMQLYQADEALPHLIHLRRRLPGNPEVQVQLAQALDQQGRIAEARALLDECLRDHPDRPGALAERGWIASRDGDGQRAEEDLGRAIQLDPSDLTAHHRYYQVLNQNGKKAEAAKEQETIDRVKADLEQINEIVLGRLPATPNDPSLYFDAGMIALRIGRPKEMLRWLQSALQVDPGHAPTHRALATYYQDTGNPILAARHRALGQRPGGEPERTKSDR
jgi:predicted Zn-dependent protease